MTQPISTAEHEIITERIAIPGELRISYDVTGEVLDTAVQQPLSDNLLELVKVINGPGQKTAKIFRPAPAAVLPSAASLTDEQMSRTGRYQGKRRAKQSNGAFHAFLAVIALSYGAVVQMVPSFWQNGPLVSASIPALILSGFFLALAIHPRMR